MKTKPWINGCWRWVEEDVPLTREEFIDKFFPQSKREPRSPMGGFATNKHGYPIMSTPASRKSRQTRFTNRINAAYEEYRAIHPNKTRLPSDA